ncbi:hypothetical protein HY634_02690 [Candidatus Uhrbacteria bacterium]|nr:hypothetical protein [Candidatus Uhrbacteria bacterium]
MEGLSQLNARQLASELVGRSLTVGARTVVIIETRPYPRRDTERPLYRKLLDLEPGGVYVSRQYNSTLCHILARGGGCVAIRTIAIHGKIVTGPGRVTAALGLTTPKSTGRLRKLRRGSLMIKMNVPIDLPPRQRQRGRRVMQGIGPVVLARFMSPLVRRWLTFPPKTRGSFPNHLKEVLRRCRNEHELRLFLA